MFITIAPSFTLPSDFSLNKLKVFTLLYSYFDNDTFQIVHQAIYILRSNDGPVKSLSNSAGLSNYHEFITPGESTVNPSIHVMCPCQKFMNADVFLFPKKAGLKDCLCQCPYELYILLLHPLMSSFRNL